VIPESVATFTATSMFMGKNWCAKCRVCGMVVTRYADTELEARQGAESVPHSCYAATQRTEA
jgi:hypothetical protein